MRILLVNPNTTEAVTDAVMAAARGVVGADTELVGVTGRFGPAIIGSRAENALAQHGVLQLVADHAAGCDAVVLAVSLDTALWACRELLAVPVVGMTEAGLLMGCTAATRLGIVTYGRRMVPFYRELVQGYGLGSRLAGVAALEFAPERTFQDGARVRAEVVAACQALVQEQGAEAVLLAGAAMAAMAPVIQDAVSVPVLDGVACAVVMAQAQAALRWPKAKVGSVAATGGRSVHGVSPSLTALLEGAA